MLHSPIQCYIYILNKLNGKIFIAATPQQQKINNNSKSKDVRNEVEHCAQHTAAAGEIPCCYFFCPNAQIFVKILSRF